MIIKEDHLAIGITAMVLNVFTTFGILYTHFKAGFIDPGIIPRARMYFWKPGGN